MRSKIANSSQDSDIEQVESSLRELAERALRSQSAIMAACGSDSRQREVAIFNQAIESQHQDGSWGSDDYLSMKPCFTAQTIDMIWHLENRQQLDEMPNMPTLMITDRIQRAVSWLRSEQRSDGGWGEDIWDTCQVLLAFSLTGLTTDDPNVSLGLSHLRSNIEENWPDRTSYWFGPGYYGSAMEAFNRFKDQYYANIALEQVCHYFDEDGGYFRLVSDDPQHAPPEWHTACVISGLRSFGSVAPHREKALRSAAWLAQRQTEEGSWNPGHEEITAYCTSRAIAALASNADTRFNQHARRGTEWFIKRCATNQSRLSTKLMAAAAIARTHSDGIVVTLPLSFVMEVADLLNQFPLQISSLHTETQIASAEVRALESQLKTAQSSDSSREALMLQSKERISQLEASCASALEQEKQLRQMLASYALKLTPNQLAIVGVVISIISILIGLIPSLFLKH